MRAGSRRLAAIACGLALIVSGCSSFGGATKANTAQCEWTLEKDPSGKVIPDKVVVKDKGTPGSCKVERYKTISITIKDANASADLTDANPGEFTTTKDARGLCRWCYVSGGGGWVCIVYPC